METLWEKKWKKCSTCEGRLLPSGSRVTLIQSSLTGIPNFMMSFYGLPVGVNKIMIYFTRLLWQEEEKNKNYNLVKWSEVCRPKDLRDFKILMLWIRLFCASGGGNFIILRASGKKFWQRNILEPNALLA